MRAIVLCAGYGTRIRPLTDRLPKSLLRIAGCTLLLDVLQHLAAQGVTAAVVNGSWKADVLRYWLDSTDLPIEVSFQFEEDPLGTAGAVKRALPLLGERFLVVYGDNLTRQPVKPLLELHSRLRAEVTIALSPAGRPSAKGIVLTDPCGRVTSFREKPPDEVAESNLANSGIYVCEGSALEGTPENVYLDFGNDLFPELLREGRVIAADTPGGYTRDIGTWDSYLLACHDVLSGTVLPYETVQGLAKGRLVENSQSYAGVSISGTFWAERGSEIGEGCFLENCVLLSGASTGRGCSLRNTLVMPGSTVPEGTLADDKYLKVF